jgi:hypothetical protein
MFFKLVQKSAALDVACRPVLGNKFETKNETSAARQQFLNKQVYFVVTE